MKLRDLLRPEHMIVPLNAVTVKEATEQLARRLVDSGAVAEPNRLRALIQDSWPEDLTSVGDHAFLPHFRTEAVRSLLISVGIAPKPIQSEKDPHRAARVVIFIVAPLATVRHISRSSEHWRAPCPMPTHCALCWRLGRRRT